MFKVLHVLSAFSVLWISAVICQDCLFRDKVWGGADPTAVYYCNQTTNKTEFTNCLPGTGYVSNATVDGCVEFGDWNDGCFARHNVSNVTCEGSNALKPRPVFGSPTSYYFCPGNISTPIEMQCPKGKGFVDHEKYLGCVSWDLWRNVTGCGV